MSLRPTSAEVLGERNGSHPVWVRAPKTGTEHYTGLTRAKLYQLATARLIKTRSLREAGHVRGVRLFLLSSILEYIGSCPEQAAANGKGAAK